MTVLATEQEVLRELVSEGYIYHADLGGLIHRVENELIAFVTDQEGAGVLTFEYTRDVLDYRAAEYGADYHDDTQEDDDQF